MANILTSDFALNRTVAPRLPSATTEYDRQYQDQFNNILRLYFNQLDNILGQLDWNAKFSILKISTTFST